MRPFSLFHQLRAAGAWTCSDAARASQTLISGKLNEVINLVVGEINAAARWTDQPFLQAKFPARLTHISLFHDPLNTAQNELASRAARSRCRLMDPAMQITGNVDGGSDTRGLHTKIMVP